jgi:hypothetical protein
MLKLITMKNMWWRKCWIHNKGEVDWNVLFHWHGYDINKRTWEPSTNWANAPRVVILGIWRLMGGCNGRAGVPTHYTGHEPGILDIFSKYSLKIPRIYSNILDISLSGGRGKRGVRAGAQTTLNAPQKVQEFHWQYPDKPRSLIWQNILVASRGSLHVLKLYIRKEE